jgi:hypothetical protein
VEVGGNAPFSPHGLIRKTYIKSSKAIQKGSKMARWSGMVESGNFLEALCGFHLASYVESPFNDRGGVMLVGPPSVLKTAFLDVLERNYSTVVSLSEVTARQLGDMSPTFYNGAIRSIVFPDFENLFGGDPRTAGRIERSIMALTGESRRVVAYDEDARFQKFQSRCTVFGAMTEKFYRRNARRWDDSGFHRRFIWSTFTLQDANLLMDCVEKWMLTDIGDIRVPKEPTTGLIRNCLDNEERAKIRTWLDHRERPHEIRFQLLAKATAALKDHYAKRKIERSAMDTMHNFSETIQQNAARMILPSLAEQLKTPILKKAKVGAH